MPYKSVRQPPAIFRNAFVFSHIASFLPLLSVIHCGQTCSLASNLVKREYRVKLQSYLTYYFPTGDGIRILETCGGCLVGYSAYHFLGATSETEVSQQPLHFFCPLALHNDLINVVLSGDDGYQLTNDFEHHLHYVTLNSYITRSTLLQVVGSQRSILILSGVNDNAVLMALGSPSTAFMTIASPSQVWSAYPFWSTMGISIRNPLYYHGPVPNNFKTLIQQVRDLFRSLKLKDYVQMWRILVEYPHKRECSLHPLCPQTLRFSTDVSCMNILFGAAIDCPEPVMWRLGGGCYSKTKRMLPLAIPVPGLDRVFED